MSTAPAAPSQNHILRGMALRSFAVISFSVMAASMKLASESGVNTIEMVFYRSLFGFPLVLFWIATGPGFGVVRTKRPKAHIVRSTIGLFGITFNFAALIHLPLADATTIGFTAPIFATILSGLLLAERIGPQRWAAVAIGFLGVLLVVRPGSGALDNAGLMFALAGALGTAGVTVAIRQLGATEHPGTIVFWFFVASGTVSGLAMTVMAQPHDAATWGFMILSGVAGAVAQISMTHSLRDAPVSVLMPLDYVQIVWATLIGWLVWAAIPGWTMLGGAALIIGSGVFTAWREQRLRREIIPATPPLE